MCVLMGERIMSEWRICKLVMLGVEDMASVAAIEVALGKAEEIIKNATEKQIVFVAPVPEQIKDWLLTGHYRLVRTRYCAMASGLGVPVSVLMPIFKSLNRAIEWAKNCGSVSDVEKQKAFLHFGERLSAELFAAALARRYAGTVVSVVDGKDILGSYFTVSFSKTLS